MYQYPHISCLAVLEWTYPFGWLHDGRFTYPLTVAFCILRGFDRNSRFKIARYIVFGPTIFSSIRNLMRITIIVFCLLWNKRKWLNFYPNSDILSIFIYLSLFMTELELIQGSYFPYCFRYSIRILNLGMILSIILPYCLFFHNPIWFSVLSHGRYGCFSWAIFWCHWSSAFPFVI